MYKNELLFLIIYKVKSLLSNKNTCNLLLYYWIEAPSLYANAETLCYHLDRRVMKICAVFRFYFYLILVFNKKFNFVDYGPEYKNLTWHNDVKKSKKCTQKRRGKKWKILKHFDLRYSTYFWKVIFKYYFILYLYI